MIWLKRALPLLIIAILWLGWSFLRTYRTEKRASEDAKHALVTAQVWVASATYRANPQSFLKYRDSLLQANNITTNQMFRYLSSFESDPSRQLSFSQQVSIYVDSLTKRPDSLSPRSASPKLTLKPTSDSQTRPNSLTKPESLTQSDSSSKSDSLKRSNSMSRSNSPNKPVDSLSHPPDTVRKLVR